VESVGWILLAVFVYIFAHMLFRAYKYRNDSFYKSQIDQSDQDREFEITDDKFSESDVKSENKKT
jgi:hypothetical protein